MPVTFVAERQPDSPGLTVAQLADVVERATREAQHLGLSTELLVPKVRVGFAGQIKKIEVTVG